MVGPSAPTAAGTAPGVPSRRAHRPRRSARSSNHDRLAGRQPLDLVRMDRLELLDLPPGAATAARGQGRRSGGSRARPSRFRRTVRSRPRSSTSWRWASFSAVIPSTWSRKPARRARDRRAPGWRAARLTPDSRPRASSASTLSAPSAENSSIAIIACAERRPRGRSISRCAAAATQILDRERPELRRERAVGARVQAEEHDVAARERRAQVDRRPAPAGSPPGTAPCRTR